VCLAIPGQIIEIATEQPLLARVNVGSVRRNVNIGLLENGEVAPGDWILIHVGFALSKIDEAQAQDQLRMLRAMGEDQLAIEEVRGYSFAEPKGEEDEIRR
jgi:hydrogenase expression/formation protein HypC